MYCPRCNLHYFYKICLFLHHNRKVFCWNVYTVNNVTCHFLLWQSVKCNCVVILIIQLNHLFWYKLVQWVFKWMFYLNIWISCSDISKILYSGYIPLFGEGGASKGAGFPTINGFSQNRTKHHFNGYNRVSLTII